MNKLVKKRGRDPLKQERRGNERVQKLVALLKHFEEGIVKRYDFVRIIIVDGGVLGKRSKQCERDETQAVVNGLFLLEYSTRVNAMAHDYPLSLHSAMIVCMRSSCRRAIGEGCKKEPSGSAMEQRHSFLHNRDK